MSFRRFISFWIVVSFFLTTLGPLPKAHADTVLGLPAPGTMVNLSPAYEPVIIKGLTVHKDNPFLFDFIVDVGQDKMSGEPLKKEGEKLIKYFLASLAIPDKDLWVNLSPYEKNRMIPEALGQTDMGRDLLEQDYILKQITASLIYPEKDLGKTFWDKVYAKAQQMYGTTQVPVNTFNKVWIMADRAEVFERNQTAFVVDSHLKVMLEEDYLALQKHNPSVIASEAKQSLSSVIPAKAGIHSLGSKIVRAIILPELEKEVNTGKNFANLRQILNSLILANWYKKNLKQALLNQVYTNQSKVKGIDLNDPTVKQQIYEQYLKAYKKGVFNYIKEDVTTQGTSIPRKYFSGGFDEAQAVINPAVTSDPRKLDFAMRSSQDRLIDVQAFLNAVGKKINAVKQMLGLNQKTTGMKYNAVNQKTTINVIPAQISISGRPKVYSSGQLIRVIHDLRQSSREFAKNLEQLIFYTYPYFSGSIPEDDYRELVNALMGEVGAKQQKDDNGNFIGWTIKKDKVLFFRGWLDHLEWQISDPWTEDKFGLEGTHLILTPMPVKFKRGLWEESLFPKRIKSIIGSILYDISVNKKHPYDSKDSFGIMPFSVEQSRPSFYYPFYYALEGVMQQKGWQGELKKLYKEFNQTYYQLNIGKEHIDDLVSWLNQFKEYVGAPRMGPSVFDADAAMTVGNESLRIGKDDLYSRLSHHKLNIVNCLSLSAL